MTTLLQSDAFDEDGVTEKMTCRQSVNAIRTGAMMMVKMMMMLFEEDVCVWWMTQLGQGAWRVLGRQGQVASGEALTADDIGEGGQGRAT